MAPLSLKKAKDANLITEKNMERMANYFLIFNEQLKFDKNIYKMAAEQIGSTPASMQVSTSALLRKLRDGNCYIEDAKLTTDAVTASAAPKATPKKSTPKKRKGDDDAGDGPAPKKPAKGKKDVEGTADGTNAEAIKDEDSF